MGNANISFFFKKGGEIFGAPEESRLAFARMKHPEPEEKVWAKDANFSAIDLQKAIGGETTQRLFSNKDLAEIKILEKDDAFKALK
jgi:hypothetical protein